MYPGMQQQTQQPYNSYNSSFPIYSMSSSQNTATTANSSTQLAAYSSAPSSANNNDYTVNLPYTFPYNGGAQQQQQSQSQAQSQQSQTQQSQNQQQYYQQPRQAPGANYSSALPPISATMYYYNQAQQQQSQTPTQQGYYHSNTQNQYGSHPPFNGGSQSTTPPTATSKTANTAAYTHSSPRSIHTTATASRYSSISTKHKVETPKIYRSVNNQALISQQDYVPSDPAVDISEFTEEDIIVLKNLLPLAEIHKWKFISNRLSKSRSKKLNSDYTIKKFHEMYNLPFNPQNSLLNSNYFLQMNKDTDKKQENFEGLLGSSIPYILCKDGWNYVD
ncbi:unnamed protein product [Ambrosiozyma monospora]|uniref:Unnamed protein product n=1 Tax=Ambrosiozyma monospora TaxID=43982 RepID=A0ACB5TJD0_AMBMO|nr:unnamed protein product [Ambrosiozyma monospora]